MNKVTPTIPGFVCVLSHGKEDGRIASSDGLDINIEVDNLRSVLSVTTSLVTLLIFRRFNNDFCPALRGKPKFFIFQVKSSAKLV